MRLGRQILLTSEFSMAFRFTQKCHLLVKTDQIAQLGSDQQWCIRCPDRLTGRPTVEYLSLSASAGILVNAATLVPAQPSED
jgi:hypothetical protein